ncbi:hypothetical protein [Kribbella sp. NPDC006257]|uniref:hypothetical protein n=1 Tax=Kribbella sp. NPDC006257 TaxID=3156738 RepID=UPI0033AFB3D3
MAVIMDGATWPGLTRDDDSWISRADFSAAYDAAHPDSLLDNRQLLAAVREGYAGKGSELRESRRGPHRGLYGFRLATVPAPARKGVRLDPGAALSLLEDTSFVGRQVTVTPGGFTSRIEVRQAADIWTIHTGHCLAPESIYAALLRLDGVRPGAVRLKGGRGFHGLARVA